MRTMSVYRMVRVEDNCVANRGHMTMASLLTIMRYGDAECLLVVHCLALAY